MRINVVQQPFRTKTNINLKSNVDLENINTDTIFTDDEERSWTLLDLELEVLNPFHLECNNFSGPVWIAEDGLVLPPNQGYSTANSFQENQSIDEFLFEPDFTRIKTISDFDIDRGYVPRWDIFGDYIGDGIMQQKTPIMRGIFKGFYEDLKENSDIFILNHLSFESKSPNSVSHKLINILDPIHILCYNADLLYCNDELEVRFNSPWITPSIQIDEYNPQEKFIIQCFEILRLTHLQQKQAGSFKDLALLAYSQLSFNELNFQVAAAALLYFVESVLPNKKEISDRIDLFEYSILYGYEKSEIDIQIKRFSEISNRANYKSYQDFRKSIYEILIEKTDHLQVELDNSLDSYFGKKIQDEYQKILTSISDPFFQLYLFGELTVGLVRVLPLQIFDLYEKIGKNLIQRNHSKLKLIENIRLLGIKNSLLIYDDFIWGPALLYNIFGNLSDFKGKEMVSLEFIHKSYSFLQNSRDLFLFLASYGSFLAKFNKVEILVKVFDLGVEYLSDQIKKNPEYINTFNEYLFLTRYVIPNKLSIKGVATQEIQLLKSILNRNRYNDIQVYSYPNLDELFDERLSKFIEHGWNYENEGILEDISLSDLIVLFYQIELNKPNPEYFTLVSLSELYLKQTKNQLNHSDFYKVRYDYTHERVKYYFNLFYFYSILDNSQKFETLKQEFRYEFADIIENDVFQMMLSSLENKTVLFAFLKENKNIQNFYLDRSLFYYINIKAIISSYLEHGNIQTVIEDLHVIIVDARSHFSLNRNFYYYIKLFYRLLLNSELYEKLKENIHQEIALLANNLSLTSTDSELTPISINELNQEISNERIVYYLASVQ